MSSKEPSHFLDKPTILALIVVALCWIGWERYIRTKYPRPEKIPAPIEAEKDQAQNKKQKTKKPSSPKEKRGQVFNFENKEISLSLSSKGMGVQKLQLINFYDRQKKPIVFSSKKDQALFEITENEEAVYFQVRRRKKDLFVGEASLKNGAKIQLQVLVGPYFLKYQISLLEGSWPTLKIQTSPLPKEGSSGGIFSLLAGKEPGLSLFIKTPKETRRAIFSEDPVDEILLSKSQVVAFGDRYFGQAFVNESEIYPRVFFEDQQGSWRAEIIFDPPKKGDVPHLSYKTFFGPKSLDVLKKTNKDLVSWVDYGFLSWLALPILSFLKFTYLWTSNWGLSIILLTIFVRLLLFPFNLFAYRSMKVMKEVQPQIQEIRKKYKTKADPQKMNQEILHLMRQKKARPLGGCLPMIIQFPVFFALYRVLSESFELYQSPFFLWIEDLSIKDPFYILPVLMGAAMFVQQKITPMNVDPVQEKVLKFLPVIFAVFMINLPSGLTLYIFVSTLFGIIQQYYFVSVDDHFLNFKEIFSKNKKTQKE